MKKEIMNYSEPEFKVVYTVTEDVISTSVDIPNAFTDWESREFTPFLLS